MSEVARPTLPGLARLIFGLALAAYVAIAGWLVWRTSILEPYSDMYDWLARWGRFRADGDLGRYLWAPHNLHHLVWTLGVLDLDIRAFGASGYLFLVVGVACLAATAAMLAVIGAAAAGPGLRLIGGGWAAALSLMGCDILDANTDINTTYVHALVFAVAAILLAEGPGPRSAVRGAGALACAMAAALGSAAGLAVWPALLFAAWRGGRRGWMLAVLATGLGFGLLYALGQTLPAGAGGQGGGHVVDGVRLFVDYLGLPWVRGLPRLSAPIGFCVLAVSLVALVTKGRLGASWPERTAVSLILFSLATAVMTGLARNGAATPGLAPMRYAVFLIPLHVGLWVLVLPYLRRIGARRPGPISAAVVAGAVVLLLHQGVMAVYAVRTADTDLRLIADFRAGQRTAPMLTTIYGDLHLAQALSDDLRRRGFYQRELRRDPVGNAP